MMLRQEHFLLYERRKLPGLNYTNNPTPIGDTK